MAGLRERKKHATRKAIHDAGMRLFAERGFAATTMEQVAEAADVSRATVFTYFASKEDIVFGDAPLALAALADQLREAPATIPAVRDWLRPLTGWMEPDLLVQRRLALEVPAVGARRAQLFRQVERVVGDAIAAELGPDRTLAARLAAATFIAALGVAEDAAAERMERVGRPLTAEEIDAILDAAVAFAEAGMETLP
jgi:AcrR family transcriptional regulator